MLEMQARVQKKSKEEEEKGPEKNLNERKRKDDSKMKDRLGEQSV